MEQKFFAAQNRHNQSHSPQAAAPSVMSSSSAAPTSPVVSTLAAQKPPVTSPVRSYMRLPIRVSSDEAVLAAKGDGKYTKTTMGPPVDEDNNELVMKEEVEAPAEDGGAHTATDDRDCPALKQALRGRGRGRGRGQPRPAPYQREQAVRTHTQSLPDMTSSASVAMEVESVRSLPAPQHFFRAPPPPPFDVRYRSEPSLQADQGGFPADSQGRRRDRSANSINDMAKELVRRLSESKPRVSRQDTKPAVPAPIPVSVERFLEQSPEPQVSNDSGMGSMELAAGNDYGRGEATSQDDANLDSVSVAGRNLNPLEVKIAASMTSHGGSQASSTGLTNQMQGLNTSMGPSTPRSDHMNHSMASDHSLLSSPDVNSDDYPPLKKKRGRPSNQSRQNKMTGLKRIAPKPLPEYLDAQMRAELEMNHSQPGVDGLPTLGLNNNNNKRSYNTSPAGIRPLDRQRMKPWLMDKLDQGTFKGLEWIGTDKKMFKVPWIHASSTTFDVAEHSKLFEQWAKHTGRYQEGSTPDPKRWKANFRCALNSLPDIGRVREYGKNGHEAFRVYRMLDDDEINSRVKVEPRSENNSPREPRLTRSASATGDGEERHLADDFNVMRAASMEPTIKPEGVSMVMEQPLDLSACDSDKPMDLSNDNPLDLSSPMKRSSVSAV